jgi:hypothetical protein
MENLSGESVDRARKRTKGSAAQTQAPEAPPATLERERKRAGPKETKIKVPKADFEEIFKISQLSNIEYARKMKTFYEENGVVCIELEDKIDTRKAVREFVRKLFGQMPYRDEFRLNFKLADGMRLPFSSKPIVTLAPSEFSFST